MGRAPRQRRREPLGRTSGRTKAAVAEPSREEQAERRGSASQHAGSQAAEILAPEAGLAALDPVSFSKALGRFGTEVARRPLPALAAMARCGTGLGLTGVAAAGRAVGLKTPGPLPPAGKDKRFADKAWEDNAAYFATGQAYRLLVAVWSTTCWPWPSSKNPGTARPPSPCGCSSTPWRRPTSWPPTPPR